MAAVALDQITREGWRNVTVVRSSAEDAQIGVTADAALFCAVHDILQSPRRAANVLARPRPGAWVAAGGGKWASPLLVGVNLLVGLLHAPYVRSFRGFSRPWSHLESLVEDVHVREVALGGGYIMTGRTPAPRGRSVVVLRTYEARHSLLANDPHRGGLCCDLPERAAGSAL
jgi:hypothetical protein